MRLVFVVANHRDTAGVRSIFKLVIWIARRFFIAENAVFQSAIWSFIVVWGCVMFSRLNRPARYWATVFQFGIPAGLFIAVGFASLASLRETLIAVSLCAVTAFLSWVVGFAIKAEREDV